MRRIKAIFSTIILAMFIFSFIEVPQTANAAAKVISAPTSVKAVSSSYNSISISWTAVTGARGYAIYRAVSSTGSYSLLSVTTAKNYKNTRLTTGRTYYYKVRAYRVSGKLRVYGNYSSRVSAKCTLSAPTSVKAEASSADSIDISWGEVPGASGYQVYKATSSEETYDLISTTSVTNYSNSKLKAGTTYYYKVRAYRLIGNSKVYSKFSSVVNATTKVVNVTSVSLNKNEDTLTVGSTDTLIASITPADATNQSVTWESSDDSIAIVDDEGTVTAIAPGTATITVTTKDGSKMASCQITVNNLEIKGIDVSKHQGTINWASVKSAGIQFAMIRSSYGKSSIDPMFQTNYTAAKANGIAVGAYHYSYAKTVADATVEVNFFISQLSGKQFEYPVCVDMEEQDSLSKSTLTSIALVYLDKLTEAGYYPMIYANKNWFTSKLDDTQLTAYDHWLAQYAAAYTYTGTVAMWQYSSKGAVKGISGNVDLDTSYVDYVTKIKTLHKNGF